MGPATITLIIILGVVLLVLVWAVGIYNRLVALKQRFANAFSQIDVQLKRRYDLIPNLVETAKGFMAHERETLEAVIAARNQASAAAGRAAANPSDGDAMRGLLSAEGALGQGLGRLWALAEAYPTLKADQTMLRLQDELTATENKIAFARQAYNDAVMVYNTAREQFPGSIVASLANFGAASPWLLDEPAARNSPKVAF
jgi:LemA protein